MPKDERKSLNNAHAGRNSARSAAISTIVTLGLTAFNAVTSHNIDNQRLVFEREKTWLQAIETSIAEVEVKTEIAPEEVREHFTRYEFVHKLLPDVLSEDNEKRMLSENLILLTLSEEEAQKLFEGLKSSRQEQVWNAGN